MITGLQKELMAIEVIRTLYSQFEQIPVAEDNYGNAPFHKAFLKAFSETLEGNISAFRIPINLMHSLNTSLDQSFFEKIAYILSCGEKREFTTKKKSVLKLSRNQKESINRIITDLTNGNRAPNLLREDNECLANQDFEMDAEDFIGDVFFEDDEAVVCIELKTLNIDRFNFKAEKEKILEAKAALRNIYPNKTVKYYLGFPFDPLSATPTGYNKSEFMKYSVDFKKYFSSEEFLLSAELWDFLSGETQTMESIIEIINTIATVDFKEKFDFFQNNQNKNNRAEYIIRLQNWYLLREKALFENQEKILSNIKYDKPLIRIFNQNIFNNSGDYNEKRCTNLQEIFKLEVKQLNVINSVDYPDIDRVVQIKKKSFNKRKEDNGRRRQNSISVNCGRFAKCCN